MKKKIIIGIIFLLIIGIGTILYLNKDLKEEVNDLEITYVGRDKVKIKKIKEDFVYEKEIIIKNRGSKLKTYSLEWTNIENIFKNQSKLLYEITSTGERSATLDKSQLPNAKSIIFPQVAILPGKSHTYKIKIWYEGDVSKEKESVFIGKLKIKSKDYKETKKVEEESKQEA